MSSSRFRERFFAELTRYEWLETLGRGGMGIVFKARDKDLDEVVAIKALTPEFRDSELDLLARFKQEIQLNRKIKHPNVARIHDYGMAGEYPYITMEYVPGKDLKSRILSRKRIPTPEAVGILRQICRGTQAAHEVGIVHRDLKPQNVMVDDAGAVAILDFGLARHARSQHLTASSLVLGTPQYISPEQALGGVADARSDIYAIGVIAFETLTGALPFQGESPVATAMKQVNDPVPDTLSSFPDVPPELVAVVHRCLEKKPDQRFQTVAELEAELAQVEEGLAAGPARSPLTAPKGRAGLDIDHVIEELATGRYQIPTPGITPVVPHRVRPRQATPPAAPAPPSA
ncbi:serine/threonine protein kinase, partial [Acidobacteria bacterium ACD]|nr:serine/threonine protein kinase [Acidobacteria bacterium ACB2]MDL1952085.1 serine/threonine protein kinase [Acidobacteria bacterium ACD]